MGECASREFWRHYHHIIAVWAAAAAAVAAHLFHARENVLDALGPPGLFHGGSRGLDHDGFRGMGAVYLRRTGEYKARGRGGGGMRGVRSIAS